MLSEEEADLALGDVARGLKADHERNLDTLGEALRRERDRQRARILEQLNEKRAKAMAKLRKKGASETEMKLMEAKLDKVSTQTAQTAQTAQALNNSNIGNSKSNIG